MQIRGSREQVLGKGRRTHFNHFRQGPREKVAYEALPLMMGFKMFRRLFEDFLRFFS